MRLEDRVRTLLSTLAGPRVVERRMFGANGFMVDGHLAVGADDDRGLLVRVGRDEDGPLLDPPWATRTVMGGREMRGWISVHPDAVRDADALRRWVTLGYDYAASLPPKPSAVVDRQPQSTRGGTR